MVLNVCSEKKIFLLIANISVRDRDTHATISTSRLFSNSSIVQNCSIKLVKSIFKVLYITRI